MADLVNRLRNTTFSFEAPIAALDLMDEAADALEQASVALMDAAAMLEHYTSGRPHNWDGSTKTQALVTIREIKTLLEKMK